MLTVIIPTYNRYHYLKRLLKYFCGNNLNVIIGDSSEIQEEFNLKMDLKISYLKLPSDYTVHQKVHRLLQDVGTQYCVICADDDFIVPSAMERCRDFLERNADYSVCQGLFYLKNKNKWIPLYHTARSLTEDTNERLVYYLFHYFPVYYGLYRTDTLRLMFNEALKLTKDIVLSEFILAQTAVRLGRVRVLPIFYGLKDIASYFTRPDKKINYLFFTLLKLKYRYILRNDLDYKRNVTKIMSTLQED